MVVDVQNKWDKFLNPDELKPFLLFCSIFITSYELLKKTAIERLVVFFSDEFDRNGFMKGSKYESEVLALDEKRNPLRSSLTWHYNNKIIDSSDLKTLQKITSCRNDLTHRILQNLTEAPINDLAEIFSQMVNLINKIERWWIINFELALTPIEDADEIDYDGITPGAIMTIRLLVDIALGEKEESEFYYREFTKSYK